MQMTGKTNRLPTKLLVISAMRRLRKKAQQRVEMYAPEKVRLANTFGGLGFDLPLFQLLQ
jgi:hypothetical protein